MGKCRLLLRSLLSGDLLLLWSCKLLLLLLSRKLLLGSLLCGKLLLGRLLWSLLSRKLLLGCLLSGELLLGRLLGSLLLLGKLWSRNLLLLCGLLSWDLRSISLLLSGKLGLLLGTLRQWWNWYMLLLLRKLLLRLLLLRLLEGLLLLKLLIGLLSRCFWEVISAQYILLKQG